MLDGTGGSANPPLTFLQLRKLELELVFVRDAQMIYRRWVCLWKNRCAEKKDLVCVQKKPHVCCVLCLSVCLCVVFELQTT